MASQQIVLPICLACLVAVLLVMGYLWIRHALKEVTLFVDSCTIQQSEASGQVGTRRKRYPQDLLEASVGGTQSIESADGTVEISLSCTGNCGKDFESQNNPKTECSGKCPTIGDNVNPKFSKLTPVSQVLLLSPEKNHVIRAPTLRKAETLKRKVKQDVKFHNKGNALGRKLKAHVDVHACTSETCDVCRCNEQVQFVSVQRL